MNRTYVTKIHKTTYQIPEVKKAIAYFEEWCEYFAMIEHRLFVDLVHRDSSINQLKTKYLKQYDITARQFNSIRAQIEGKISSLKELKEDEQAEKTSKLEQFNSQIETLTQDKDKLFKRLEKTPMNSKKHRKLVNKYRSIKSSIHYIKRKIIRYTHKLKQIETDTSNDVVRLCFGTKDLFSKQFRLKENNYSNHEEWLRDWKNARQSQFFMMGSSDETFGNQNCQYGLDNTLKIRVAKYFESKYGEYVYIPNVTFKYGQEYVDKCKSSFMGETKTYKPKKYYRTPATYRIMKKEHGWYIGVTVQKDDVEIITDSRIGAIGVDFNVNFVSICFIDRFGNPLDELTIKCPMYNKASG